MFANQLLLPEIQEFITKNIGNDISKMALQKNPFPEVEWITILNQIAAKAKAKDRLPTYFTAKNIIYPAKISVEQTSSEKTARYKSSIVFGESLIDMTGGFGVDDFFFSKKVHHLTHCEINEELSAIVKHNFLQLQATNIECYAGNSSEILEKLNRQFDWIYIDPSRRSDTKGKVFMLKDCLPNVPELLSFYFKYSKNLLIKTAPILDISAGLSELEGVKTIHIVAVDNEVKELLWELNADYFGETRIKTVNILKEKEETFEFISKDNPETPTYSLPRNYLYEPNSAIMKSGGFDEVGAFYKLNKLHKHSHLYTNSTIIPFPGRIFEIQNSIPYHKTEMKTHLENMKANITTRNFPETVENIRKKWKIKEGGNVYCFFTTDLNNNKIVLLCGKLK